MRHEIKGKTREKLEQLVSASAQHLQAAQQIDQMAANLIVAFLEAKGLPEEGWTMPELGVIEINEVNEVGDTVTSITEDVLPESE